MNRRTLLAISFMVATGAVWAVTIDLNVTVQEILIWASNKTGVVNDKNAGQVIYFADGNNISSDCNGSAVIWAADSTDKNISVTVTEVIEEGNYFKLQVGQTDYNLSNAQTYSFRVPNISDKVCLKGVIRKTGKSKFSYDSFKVVT